MLYFVKFVDEGNCDIDFITLDATDPVEAIEIAYCQLIDSVEPDEVYKVEVERAE